MKLPNNATLEERERFAYIAGELEKVELLQKIQELKEDSPVVGTMHSGGDRTMTKRQHSENQVVAKRQHKHAELLRAIADGEQIQLFYESAYEDGHWGDISHELLLALIDADLSNKWRIKPQPKPNTIRCMFVEAHPKLDNAWNTPNLELTFDGETQKLKAVRILDAA